MTDKIMIWCMGLFVSVVLGHPVIWSVVSYFRVTRKVTPVSKEASIIGLLERALYTTAFVLQMYFLLGVWIGAKMAGRWTPRGIPGKPTGEEVGAINVFLIGNLLSLLFGIVGGCFIVYHLKQIG